MSAIGARVEWNPQHMLFDSDEKRTKMAQFVETLMGNDCTDGSFPYTPNVNDTMWWTLDRANDWHLGFFSDEQSTLIIEHRYSNKTAETALAEWIAYRMGGKVISKP